MTACSRTARRSPLKWCALAIIPVLEATAIQTNPTGLSGDPPSGPAIPVIPTPTADSKRCRTPSAIPHATVSLTAPAWSIHSFGTPSCTCLTSLEYAIVPPTNHWDDPARCVQVAPSNQPVQLSATDSVAFCAQSAAARSCTSVSASRFIKLSCLRSEDAMNSPKERD